MGKGTKRRGAAPLIGLVLAGAVVAGAVFLLKSRTASRSNPSEVLTEGEAGDRWRGFAAAMPGVSADTPADPSAPPAMGNGGGEGAGWLAPKITREQMDLALDGWRQAIQDKNSENVIALDRVFTLLPGRYGPQLEKLARTDEDERVRAFSTRVLGKMKNVEIADLYKKLLSDDKSPYVRQNAAWALGELILQPNGRKAIEDATGDLRHAEGSDPAPDVRAEATKTLKKLQ
jgi:hypothetical protein